MKPNKQTLSMTWISWLALAILLNWGINATRGADVADAASVTLTADESEEDAAASGRASKHRSVIIKTIEPDGEGEREARKELAWLGVSTEEASEALTSQLGLDLGVGLVVTYVSPKGPAATAGLKKTDVLTEFEGHALSHPAQLRRLVQARKGGDAIKWTYYRAGKKESASATLTKTPASLGGMGEMGWEEWKEDLLRGLPQQLRDRPMTEAFREQMNALRESLGKVRIDQEQVRREVRRGLEEARKAMKEALRHARDAKAFGPAADLMEDLVESDVQVKEGATVTVNNTAAGVRTMVKTDASGAYTLVASPTKHLTVHDKKGQLLFEGEIETPEQQGEVPEAIWKKVKPMLKKLDAVQEKKSKKLDLEAE